MISYPHIYRGMQRPIPSHPIPGTYCGEGALPQNLPELEVLGPLLARLRREGSRLGARVGRLLGGPVLRRGCLHAVARAAGSARGGQRRAAVSVASYHRRMLAGADDEAGLHRNGIVLWREPESSMLGRCVNTRTAGRKVKRASRRLRSTASHRQGDCCCNSLLRMVKIY